ncbi:MAG TPA: methionyl-tRNA formyltransferase [Bacteroidia bacterium]|jgi:methionyl-tRNA formyltransferase|nr:methionyl-tRNA formyltransferase [Bacteroidia bacterium]
MSDLRIVFMGTPEFAVASLDILLQNGYNIVGVITAPDRPAGRGLELMPSDVKKYALSKGLNILQPEKLKNETFLSELKALKADLQIVVAFRMLPELVWNMPRLGTINLHGSLLPQYRGAAPINRAVMNGETETGVSTFFLQQQIDTGKIIFREKTPIGADETTGELHDRLMMIGAGLVLKTVQAIEKGDYPQIDQQSLLKKGDLLKEAPKLFKEDCRIRWSDDIHKVHNFIRGLSPYPAAFTELVSPDGKSHPLKIYKAQKEESLHQDEVGKVLTDEKTFLKIAVPGGYINIQEMQLAGKRKMATSEFLRGFQLKGKWTVNP